MTKKRKIIRRMFADRGCRIEFLRFVIGYAGIGCCWDKKYSWKTRAVFRYAEDKAREQLQEELNEAVQDEARSRGKKAGTA